MKVTPLVGVWIEINLDALLCLAFSVTPLVGVWIEICVVLKFSKDDSKSLPLWECGLK